MRRSLNFAFSPISKLKTESGVKFGCEDTWTGPAPQWEANGLTASTAAVGIGMGRLKPPGRDPLSIVPYTVRSLVGSYARFSFGRTALPLALCERMVWSWFTDAVPRPA